MNKIVFETPGLLDLRAVSMFGINSKPHSENPFGYFGTGLKYAIAILLREGCEVTIVADQKFYHFSVRNESFREKAFGFIFMNDDQLPYTTELGKNWKLWQAFRELHSNTIDESGETYCAEQTPRTVRGRTYIIVEGNAFVREFDERFNTFLRDGARTGSGVQIIDAESHHIFYRGIRVSDLEKPSALTYNILDQITLTEDRTAKHAYETSNAIKAALVANNDEILLRKALNAENDRLEASFDFSDMWQTPSETFAVVGSRSLNRSAYTLIRNNDKDWLQAQRERHIFDQMIDCIKANEWYKFRAIAEENANAVLCLLISADRAPIAKEPVKSNATPD